MFTKIDFIFSVDYDRDNHSIIRDEQHDALKLIRKEAAQIFSAYTLVASQGGWTNDAGKLTAEDGFVLTTIQKGAYNAPATYPTSKVHEMAQVIKSALNQESVAVCAHDVNFQFL